MTVSIWQADDTQPTRDVDVLVVGAGLVGTASAYFLQQAGREVVITEMRDAGLGASGRNAGFMITGTDTYYHRAIEHYGHDAALELWKLSEKTHAYWREFIKQSGKPVKFEQSGSFLLAENEQEAVELRDAVRALHKDKIDVVFHEKDPLERGYCAAIEQPWDAAVQPFELVQAILALSGAELVANNELYAIEQVGPECVTVYTQKWIFRARKVLLCTNAYSPRIDPFFVGKVIPTRGQCLVTEPLPEAVVRGCGYSDYGYMYYRMTFDNRLLIGGARKNYKDLENDTTDDRTIQPIQNALDAYLRRRFPDVAAKDVQITRRWAGIMGFTTDGIPLVGTLPDKPDVGFAVGFHGHGLAMGAGTAERAVDMLLNSAAPGVVDARRLRIELNTKRKVTQRNCAIGSDVNQRRSLRDGLLSRREFLIAAGVLGGGTAAACACGMAGLIYLAYQDEEEGATPATQVAAITATPREILSLDIVPRADWGALPPDHSAANENGFYSDTNLEGWRYYASDLTGVYQTVVIHHAAIYEGNDTDTLLEIQRAHREERGWADVGYHYLVGQEGLIYEGRDIHVRGTHVAGFNTGSAGVCLLGNFMNELPSEAQITSTFYLVYWLASLLNPTHLATHRDFNSETVCPGDYLMPYIADMANYAGLSYGTGGYIAPTPTPPSSAQAGCACCGCRA